MKKLFTLLSFLLIAILCFSGCEFETPNPEYPNNQDPNKEFIDYASQLTLLQNPDGRSFVNDGIGRVRLSECVDGDTAHFYDSVTNQFLKIRFYGIDTPESTGQIEPWGKPASHYTCNKLKNASEIVLEAEGSSAEIDSTGKRYLGWVWVDGKLLNLELVQESYSKAKGASGTKYGDWLQNAEVQATPLKKYIWGTDKDPEYYYGDAIATNLKALRENPEEYLNKKVKVEGLVTRKIGTNAYIEYRDYDEETGEFTPYGMYVYTMFVDYKPLKVGNYVKIVGTLSVYETTGAYQIVGVSYSAFQGQDDMQVLETNQEVTPTEITYSTISQYAANAPIENTFVKINGITINGGYDSNNNDAMTLKGIDASGNEVQFRIDTNSFIYDKDGNKVESYTQMVGSKIDVQGIISVYNNAYQIMIVSTSDITYLD